MGSLGLVAVHGRGWRGFAAPVAFLLAVTIAVVVVRSMRHTPAPAPTRPRGFGLYQSTTPIAPLKRFYRVVGGDTLGGIAAKTGVPLPRIRLLNPNVAPTALFLGEKIRLR